MKARLHHIGIVVRDLDEAVRTFEKLYDGKFRRSGPELAAMAGVEVAADWRIGIELVRPIDGATQPTAVKMREFLETRGEGIFGMVHDIPNLAEGDERAEGEGLGLMNRVVFDKETIDQELGGAFEHFEESVYDAFDRYGCSLSYQVMKWKERG